MFFSQLYLRETLRKKFNAAPIFFFIAAAEAKCKQKGNIFPFLCSEKTITKKNIKHIISCSAPTTLKSHDHTCKVCGVVRHAEAMPPLTPWNMGEQSEGCKGETETK
jgi:hypothetical protein